MKCFRLNNYKKRDLLCKAGNIPDHLYYICSGLIKFYYIDYDGNEHVKDFFFEDCFASSYASFIYQNPSPYFIEALEDSVVLELSYNTMKKSLESSDYWKEIARISAERLYYHKEKKESSLLLEKAPDRYKRFLDEYSPIVKRLKQKDIASFLNIMPESFSRIKKSIK